jgi:hypothetical protein
MSRWRRRPLLRSDTSTVLRQRPRPLAAPTRTAATVLKQRRQHPNKFFHGSRSCMGMGGARAEELEQLEAEERDLVRRKNAVRKGIKKKKQRDQRLMSKAASNLSNDQLMHVVALRAAANAKAKAKAACKAAGKAVGKAKAAAKGKATA